MRLHIFIIAILCSGLSFAQSNFSLGARSAALGGANTTLSDVWSAQNNQAGLGFIKKTEFGAYYENRFLLKELSFTGAAVAIPLKQKGALGVTFTNFGYSVFRQSKVGLGYGMKFGENFSAGIELDYLMTQISDAAGFYGRKGVPTGALGFQAKLTKQVIFAAHLYNPVKAKITNYNNEIIPATLKAGLQYNLSDKVLFVAGAEKSTYQKFRFNAGMEYLPAKDFYLRGGISTQPVQMSFGAGMNLQGLKIDLSSSWHSILGFSPQFGLSYALGQAKQEKSETEKK